MVLIFSNYKCTAATHFIIAYQIVIYIERFSIVLAFFVYFLLWRQIKNALKRAATDEQKKRNFEKGWQHILICEYFQRLMVNKYLFTLLALTIVHLLSCCQSIDKRLNKSMKI